MKTRMETRMECLRLAVTIGASKTITPKEIVPTAMEFFRWVDDDPADTADVDKLRERWPLGR